MFIHDGLLEGYLDLARCIERDRLGPGNIDCPVDGEGYDDLGVVMKSREGQEEA